MLAKSKKTILHDPRYADFCARYWNDFPRYFLENSRHPPTWQQLDVAEALTEPGCRVACASGHGTGKSAMMAWLLDWHLRVFPMSNALLTATNIDQCRSVIWKYLDEVQADMAVNYPWQNDYFIKETKRYYARGYKDSWYVIPKTASKAKPENVAGQHNKYYIVVVDEASGVEDVIHGVLRGALTHQDNRYVMMSQPTRPVGHFAEAFSNLKEVYTTFNLNAEESPLVSKKFISEKLIEYGGHHSPEYQIKVLGRLPDNLAGFLIPKTWLEDAQHVKIEHPEAWGYVITVDVAEGVFRDSSVYTVGKVSGYEAERRVEVIECEETNELDEMKFAREIYQVYLKYPNCTVTVDADGPGRTVILILEELGVQVERIHWGLPPHSDSDRKRYKNQRAYASVKAREALFGGRFKVAQGKKIVEQGSRIPYKINEMGQYTIMPKEQMREKGLKSPDLFDTHCFFFLTDFIPTGEQRATETENDIIAKALEILKGD